RRSPSSGRSHDARTAMRGTHIDSRRMSCPWPITLGIVYSISQRQDEPMTATTWEVTTVSDLAEAVRQLADYHVKSRALVVQTPDGDYRCVTAAKVFSRLRLPRRISGQSRPELIARPPRRRAHPAPAMTLP